MNYLKYLCNAVARPIVRLYCDIHSLTDGGHGRLFAKSSLYKSSAGHLTTRIIDSVADPRRNLTLISRTDDKKEIGLVGKTS